MADTATRLLDRVRRAAEVAANIAAMAGETPAVKLKPRGPVETSYAPDPNLPNWKLDERVQEVERQIATLLSRDGELRHLSKEKAAAVTMAEARLATMLDADARQDPGEMVQAHAAVAGARAEAAATSDELLAGAQAIVGCYPARQEIESDAQAEMLRAFKPLYAAARDRLAELLPAVVAAEADMAKLQTHLENQFPAKVGRPAPGHADYPSRGGFRGHCWRDRLLTPANLKEWLAWAEKL